MNARSSGVRTRVLLSVTALWLLAGTAEALAKPRTVAVFPFIPVDPPQAEQWVGEGVAESLMLGLAHVPTLVQIERQRVNKQPLPPARWDEASVTQTARALRADVALYGEARWVSGVLTLHPHYLEFRGERPERGALPAVSVAEGDLMAALRGLPVAYARALKVALGAADIARVERLAGPAASARAFEWYVRGRLAWYRGVQEGYEAAVDLLGRAVEMDPHFVAAQYTLGLVHQSLGNRWKAAAQFRASTQLDPTYPEPYKALGDLFLTAPRRLFDQAAEAYTKALEIRPFYADALAGLGDARAAKGDVDGAVAAYQQALAHNPANPRVHVSLGKIYYAEKSLYYEAVAAYKKGIDLDPLHAEARMGLAEVYEDKGLYQEAIEQYRKVVEMDARNTNALYNLALVYEKIDAREAITLWERYIQLAGSLPSEKDWVEVARLHLRKLKNQLEKDKDKDSRPR
jgi:tetratricopeptide (TPR) repeat protein